MIQSKLNDLKHAELDAIRKITSTKAKLFQFKLKQNRTVNNVIFF